jgi:tetratricopeptide (TPR) repeat protein
MEIGRVDDARAHFEVVAKNDFAGLPKDPVWMAAMEGLAEVAAFLGDRERAAVLYRMLEPYAAMNAVVGGGFVCTGPVSWYLGLLATTLGRFAEARAHFEGAIAMSERLRAKPLVARVRHDYARMLLRLGSAADLTKAKSLLERAAAAARKLGMRSLLEKAEALERELSAATAPGAAGRSIFRREGDFWTIAHHGRAFALRDMKGLHSIARLLREPGREVHSLELAGEDVGPTSEEQHDRRRLAHLRADLEEAERQNDVGRREMAREEVERLLTKLARAAGLGGEDAGVERAAQRARVNASRTIKDAIARIREHDPGLARHLANAIHTGVLCSYTPESGTEAFWTF